VQLSALDSGLGFFSCLCLIEYYVAEFIYLGLDVMPCSSSKMGCLFLVSSVHVIISSSSLVLQNESLSLSLSLYSLHQLHSRVSIYSYQIHQFKTVATISYMFTLVGSFTHNVCSSRNNLFVVVINSINHSLLNNNQATL
jgi:hypothetical protein